MRILVRAVGVWLAAAVALAGAAQDPQAPTFHSGVQTIVIYATVQETDGRLIPDLTRSDFTLLDNGTPATITTFSNERQPLTVALLLDMSSSMTGSFLRVRESTLRFIDALLPGDRVRIGTFGTEIALSPILTGDKAVLARIAREELWPGGSTPMWNAMYAGMDSLAQEAGRRVILVLTDGADSGGLKGWKGSLGDVRTRATREGFMLYAIGMGAVYQPPADEKAPKSDITRLIDATGGGQFYVSDTDDLAATFARVADELRHQYLIGFVPLVSDGKEHRLEVRVTRPGARARARTTYVAGSR